MSNLSRMIFLKQDPRKIRSLFELLISENLMIENIFEHTASTINKGSFEKALIFTGFPKGETYETDGPIGSFVIANLLHDYLNIPKVTIAVPYAMKERILSLCKRILPNVNLKSIEDVGIDHRETTLAISIEFPGPNRLGIFHHMDGKVIDPTFILKKDPIVYLRSLWLGIEKQNPDSLTIGIGDGGNELGLGMYESHIREIIPFGNKCSCPCNAGIASSMPSNITLLGNTSNWAAFALASALGYDFSHEIYHLWLLELNKLGIVDGVTGKIAPTVDGIDPLVDKAIITKLFQ
ncbi:MAG: glutamate cyclase domain-containing protein [Candidatus Hodarchaeales archaeon]|jgi:hypothetical protein